jgi:hypothetical protein
MRKEKQAQRTSTPIAQPEPFTPGITRTMVREHAFALYRDKLNHEGTLTLEDWVLAEKDLVKDLQTSDIPE